MSTPPRIDPSNDTVPDAHDSLDEPSAEESDDRWLAEIARVPAVPVHHGPALGAVLGGRYRLTRALGRGGMGSVYEALDLELALPVAVKLLTRIDPQGIYRLKNEFRSLSGVAHPNLVQMHDLFEDAGQWCLVMELVRGRDFMAAAHEAPPGSAAFGALFGQLADGVEAIHAAGKLHRDLKPSNVLVCDDGRVVLLDFGLVTDREVGGAGNTLSEGEAGGTPRYMAPEQAEGPAGPAADWYAFGVVLFEAIARRAPFEGRMHQVIAKKVTTEAPALSSLGLDVDPALDDLCRRLLARDPAARPDAVEIRAHFASAPEPSGERALPTSSRAFFGRERELDAMAAAFERTEAGAGIALLVHGVSGIGKSRLVERFLETMRERAIVLTGRCYEWENVAFKGVDAVVDDFSRYLRRQEPVAATALLPRDVSVVARLFPALGRVPVVAEAPIRAVRDPDHARTLGFAAFRELFERLRDRRPVIVHIDDAQWMDADSARILEALWAGPEDLPLLMVLSYRAEEVGQSPPLDRLLETMKGRPRPTVVELPLSELGGDAARSLARAWLPPDAEPELDALIARECDGVPFFVEELARANREPRPRLAVRRHALTLDAALRERLDALPEIELRALRAVALSGRPVAVKTVLEAAEVDEQAVAVLRRLGAASLVKSSGGRLTAYHDRVREAVVGAMDERARRALHGALAASLQRALGDIEPLAREALQRDDLYAEPRFLREDELAQRRSRGHVHPYGDLESFVTHLEGAGREASAAWVAVWAGLGAHDALAFDQAASFFRRARGYGGLSAAERTRVAKLEGQSHRSAGNWSDGARAFEAAAEAEADPEEARTLHLQAAVLWLRAGIRERAGRQFDKGVGDRRALQVATSPFGAVFRFVEEAVRRRFGARTPMKLLSSGEPEGMARTRYLRQLDALRDYAQGILFSDGTVGLELILRTAWFYAASGESQRARVGRASLSLPLLLPASSRRIASHEAWLRETAAEAGARGEPYVQAYCLRALGTLHQYTRRWRRAIEPTRESGELFRTRCVGTSWEVMFAHITLVVCSAAVGDYASLQAAGQLVLDRDDAGDELTVLPLLYFGAAGLAARMDPEQLDWRIGSLRRRLGDRITQHSHLALDFGAAQLARSMGRAHQSVAVTEWDALWRALRWIGSISAPIDHFYAALAAEWAGAATGSERRRYLRMSKRAARATARKMRGLGLVADAARLRAAGRLDGCVDRLRDGIVALEAEDVMAHRATAMRHLGILLGGDEGAGLVRAADEWLLAQGVRDPVALADALTPGFRPR